MGWGRKAVSGRPRAAGNVLCLGLDPSDVGVDIRRPTEPDAQMGPQVQQEAGGLGPLAGGCHRGLGPGPSMSYLARLCAWIPAPTPCAHASQTSCRPSHEHTAPRRTRGSLSEERDTAAIA